LGAVKMTTKREKWPGGYIHRQKDGQELFILEREVGGVRYHVSTKCHSMRSAMKHLERFEVDPAGYTNIGKRSETPIFITAGLVDDFHNWMLTRHKPSTRKHANSVVNRMAAWTEDLAGVDLRTATLRDHIKPALERRRTQRAHRISTIKSFYSWLRTEKNVLISSQDCTLDLPVPQSTPEKRKRRKAVDFKVVRAVGPHLTGPYRDVLAILAATGWHYTELERLVRDPNSEIVRMKRGKTIAVLVTKQKGGEETRTPVTDRGVLGAAVRLRARGKMPKRPNERLRAACKKAGVPVFTCGVMRHSVATWAIERKAIPALVAEFLNHKDPRTTKRFYADVRIPTVNVPLPQLRLVKA
jgi:integrase